MMHNDPTAGHFAVDVMANKIKTRYYWPQYYEDIRKYVAACDACQKRGRNQKNNVLHPIPVHSAFYQIGIDIVALVKKGSILHTSGTYRGYIGYPMCVG